MLGSCNTCVRSQPNRIYRFVIVCEPMLCFHVAIGMPAQLVPACFASIARGEFTLEPYPVCCLDFLHMYLCAHLNSMQPVSLSPWSASCNTMIVRIHNMQNQ